MRRPVVARSAAHARKCLVIAVTSIETSGEENCETGRTATLRSEGQPCGNKNSFFCVLTDHDPALSLETDNRCLLFNGSIVHTIEWKLATWLVVAVSWIPISPTESSVDKLQPLIETSARRLEVATQVAFAKWDSGTPVENDIREAQVIEAAVAQGEARGLDRAFVTKFFRAQIEANKLVQYSLLADWNRMGAAPVHKSIDLEAAIRPELDQLQRKMISELVDTGAVRESPKCGSVTAQAVGKYVAAHRQNVRSLQAIALDRAMAANCATTGRR
jgi:chorismate mutase